MSRGWDSASVAEAIAAPGAMTVARILAAVRELLGTEACWFSRHRDGEMVVEGAGGDAESFGIRPGTRVALETTYCSRVLAGELPPVIPVIADEPVAAEMACTVEMGVGTFASVPLRTPDGGLHGTLCAASHPGGDPLDARDVHLLQVLSRLLGDLLERDALRAEAALQRARAVAVRALSAAVDARDAYTGAHAEEVVALAGRVARRLGLSAREVADVELVALLHDLGKLSIPDAVLHHDGPLGEDQWRIMHTHPGAGAGLVARIGELAHLAPAIRAEHERWDGRGYPDGLRGAAIPVEARITLVCDAFHAMTSDRPYRRAMAHEAAIAELEACAGTQFCPRCAGALAAELRGEGDPPAHG